MRERKTHAFVAAGQPALCGVERGWLDGLNVTCLVCLYHLGLYVPLVKLREHQFGQIEAARARAYRAMGWDVFP